MATLPCPDGAGSINNPTNPSFPGTPVVPNPYVPPELCVGTLDLTQTGDDTFQENVAAENINISGLSLNIFKLLGVHEQGKLVDLTGNGRALGSSALATRAFDDLAGSWVSAQTGVGVVTAPAWLGYDFGPRLTSFGSTAYMPHVGNSPHITSFKIDQPRADRRALQVRIERGGDALLAGTPLYTGTGNGTFTSYAQGPEGAAGTLVITLISATQFSVAFIGPTTTLLGTGSVNIRFHHPLVSFTILAGTTPFVSGDTFSVVISPEWLRVDVVNLPNQASSGVVRFKQSAQSRYWRLVPTAFSGAPDGEPWEVENLELLDYAATSIDDIQDTVLMENRDRDYAKASVQFKATYSPLEAISDLSKFGFQLADIYAFSAVFADVVRALGRPLVIGDIIELPSEVQYDHHLRPVRKFLEVTDTAWAADGFTTQWRPIIFKFNAVQLIPGQEHRDLLGTVDTQKYGVEDTTWMDGLQQIQTAPLTVTEANAEEARQDVPEHGTQAQETASGTNRFRNPGTYDGVGLYVEDGLPPDGQPYEVGYTLPDVAGLLDGAFYRLEYPPETKIPARLYKFSALKNKWIYVETDRRSKKSSLNKAYREIFDRGGDLKALKDAP